MQLVAYGAQDVYISGNPQITYFKVVYRRHTNFATENIRLPLTNANFGNTAYVVVTRNADLITQCYLEVKIPQISVPTTNSQMMLNGRFAWARKIGHCLLDYYYIDVGGTTMDKQYADWLNIWQELTLSADQKRNYAKLIGDVPELTKLGAARADGVFTDQYTVYLPLQLWFCRNNGLALPLIALQYHEVRLYFKFRAFDDCVIYNGAIGSASALQRGGQSTASSLDAYVAIEYIYLDADERRRFAQVGHEYLIEQVQYSNDLAVTSTSINQQMYFNHPTKLLTWLVKSGSYLGGKFLAYSHEAADSTSADNWAAAIKRAGDHVLLSQIRESSAGNFTIYATKAAADADAALSANSAYEVCEFSVVDPTKPAAPAVRAWGLRRKESEVLLRPSYSGASASEDLGNRSLLNCSHYVVSKAEAIAVDGTDAAPTYALSAATLTSPFIDALSGAYCAIPATTVNAMSVITLSRPLQKYTDNRPAWVKAFDVTVWQHHNYGVLIDGTVNPIQGGNIKLNGQDRMEVKDGNFYNYLQPFQTGDRSPCDGLNTFALGLKPMQHQPAGACNMSRIDTAQLVMSLTAQGGKQALLSDALRTDLLNLGTGASAQVASSRLLIFAFSYNVFRVMSGMGGLAYSN
jgi:hypothetical protein